MPGTGGSFEERRRSERHAVHDVTGTLYLSTDARVVNMSMTGMAVETAAHLPVGTRYAITLGPPSDPGLQLTGSVVWSRMRPHSPQDAGECVPVHEAGFRFHHTMGQRAADLARILQAAAATEVSRRMSGRFKVDLGNPLSLRNTVEFAARNLSAVGILAEVVGSHPFDTFVGAELRHRDFSLRTPGRIARMQETLGARGEPLRQLGIDFVDSSADGREAIREFVRRCTERLPPPATG